MTHLISRWLIAVCVVQTFAWTQPKDQYFNSNGVSIRYIEQGSGEPLVLIHGFMGSLDGWIKRGIIDSLARRYRVIALDCRGHGKSGKPHDVKLYGPEMGQDVVRLLDQLGIQQAHIAGYSMGAHITAHLLTTNPERFLTATLGGAPGRLDWTAEDDRRIEIEAKEMEEGVLRSSTIRLTPKGALQPTETEIRARSAEALAGQDQIALAAVRRSNRDQAVTSRQMAAVQVPTIGIVGSADPYLEGFKRLHIAMLHLKLVVIDGGTHGSTHARPEFLKAMLDFLAAHRAQSQTK